MLWAEIKSLFITEMEQLPNLPQPQNKSLKKTFRKCQPFWNPELANLWFSTCQAEKRYLEFKVYSVRDLPQKNNLKTICKTTQQSFDNRFRYFKRQYSKSNQEVLHKMAVAKSPNIWDQIKKLNCPPKRPKT